MPKKNTNRVHPDTAKLLRRTGYYRSLEKYGESRGPDFPDLRVEGSHRTRYPSLDSTMPSPGPAVEDARPVDTFHKHAIGDKS